MQGVPYGTTPGEQLAFALSHPARRYALMHAARYGRVHARDIQREFTDYHRVTAHNLLHVMRDRGLIKPDLYVMDVQGRVRQLTYVLTPKARQGLRELLQYSLRLEAALRESAPLPTEVMNHD